MSLLEILFGNNNQNNNRSIMKELNNLQDFGIDELENTKNKIILKEKFTNYEYYTEDCEE